MPTIVVADPSLVVLIGAAGAGKSSLASRHFQPDEILSSDAFRERIAGDAADQRVSAVAFRLLHRELERRLAARQLTVVDATNAVAANRAQLLRRAMSARIWASAIVPVFFVARAGKAAYLKRASFDFRTTAVSRVLGAAFVLAILDLATLVGFLRWLLTRALR